jgi:hypothetical protein
MSGKVDAINRVLINNNRLLPLSPRPGAVRAGEAAMDGGSVSSSAISGEVEVLSAKEAWSEYQLADGTVLRLKPIMIGISRVPDAQTADGDPVYNMKSTLITDVRPARG